jgi:hypothetical protein
MKQQFLIKIPHDHRSHRVVGGLQLKYDYGIRQTG